MHVYIFHVHAFKLLVGPAWYERLASIGYVGVSLFFVLSGFVLVYTYAERRIDLAEFWRARFARIYPAYLFSLLVTIPGFLYVLFYMPLPPELGWILWFKEHLVLTFVSVVTLTQAWMPRVALGCNSVAWSLSVEAFFYAVFPFLLTPLKKFGNGRLLAMVGVSWIGILLATSAYLYFAPDGIAVVTPEMNDLFWLNFLKFNPLLRLPEFLVGMCTGLLYVRKPRHHNWAMAMIVAGFALVGLGAAVDIPYPLLHDGLLAPAFAMIVFGLAHEPKPLRFLSHWFIQLLGESSYSFYLIHSLMIAAIFRPNNVLTDWGWGPHILCLSAAILASIGIFKSIEQPARKKLRSKSPLRTQLKPVSISGE